ncbi:hypothetical protein ABL78_5028 [Leptomonas seymouri]|uniref:Uncharacterized protein n=1 Tax=Leptomonas seymouri TaxID=5684 RepID=A0A0N0P503_LEPSE|nr:hypothetical protein ABL78_5028 [Leptomonas seymouri]|eukprot:KPI85896.1 hypothetical protein ABL78_5028 [Leptomonas seymouri]
MSELLPLSERSFRALEDAYDRQLQHARLLHQQSPLPTSSASLQRLSHSAGAAAKEMQRLCSEVRHLHRRFQKIAAGTEPTFSEGERARLSLLGFDVTPLSSSPIPYDNSFCEMAQCCGEQHSSSLQVEGSAEVAALRLENAQLLSSLAWYSFREKAADASFSASHQAMATAASHSSSSFSQELLKRLNAVRALSESLSRSQSSRLPAPEPCDAQSAVDVAIQELLKLQQFPPQVRVKRIESSSLYMLDRPVCITFASPQSTTLVVRDPEGVEEDRDLRAHLMHLYGPLLRALNWHPPSTSDAGVPAARRPFLSDNCRSLLPSFDSAQTAPPTPNIRAAARNIERERFPVSPYHQRFDAPPPLSPEQRARASSMGRASAVGPDETQHFSATEQSAFSMMTHR